MFCATEIYVFEASKDYTKQIMESTSKIFAFLHALNFLQLILLHLNEINYVTHD